MTTIRAYGYPLPSVRQTIESVKSDSRSARGEAQMLFWCLLITKFVKYPNQKPNFNFISISQQPQL
jgi:hypothetical protein